LWLKSCAFQSQPAHPTSLLQQYQLHQRHPPALGRCWNAAALAAAAAAVSERILPWGGPALTELPSAVHRPPAAPVPRQPGDSDPAAANPQRRRAFSVDSLLRKDAGAVPASKQLSQHQQQQQLHHQLVVSSKVGDASTSKHCWSLASHDAHNSSEVGLTQLHRGHSRLAFPLPLPRPITSIL